MDSGQVVAVGGAEPYVPPKQARGLGGGFEPPIVKPLARSAWSLAFYVMGAGSSAG